LFALYFILYVENNHLKVMSTSMQSSTESAPRQPRPPPAVLPLGTGHKDWETWKFVRAACKNNDTEYKKAELRSTVKSIQDDVKPRKIIYSTDDSVPKTALCRALTNEFYYLDWFWWMSRRETLDSISHFVHTHFMSQWTLRQYLHFVESTLNILLQKNAVLQAVEGTLDMMCNKENCTKAYAQFKADLLGDNTLRERLQTDDPQRTLATLLSAKESNIWERLNTAIRNNNDLLSVKWPVQTWSFTGKTPLAVIVKVLSALSKQLKELHDMTQSILIQETSLITRNRAFFRGEWTYEDEKRAGVVDDKLHALYHRGHLYLRKMINDPEYEKEALNTIRMEQQFAATRLNANANANEFHGGGYPEGNLLGISYVD
jgi:sulfur transfer complex TusBCD TusB component (DsrH family)